MQRLSQVVVLEGHNSSDVGCGLKETRVIWNKARQRGGWRSRWEGLAGVWIAGSGWTGRASEASTQRLCAMFLHGEERGSERVDGGDARKCGCGVALGNDDSWEHGRQRSRLGWSSG